MAERLRTSPIITAAVFLLLEIAAIALLYSSSTLQNGWISKVSHRAMGFMWGGSEHLHQYLGLNTENERLSEENALLRQQLTIYKNAYDEQAHQYKDTLGEGLTFITARVVKVSKNSQNNYIILDKGSDDGIRPNSGIISANGVVGIVNSVDKKYSYGITLMNNHMSLSARIGHDGQSGPLSWDGLTTDGARLNHLPFQSKFEPGDTIFTSGYSILFPSDIPVGIAVDSKTEDGSSMHVNVKLLQDFRSLRFVSVIVNAQEEIEKIESDEQE